MILNKKQDTDRVTLSIQAEVVRISDCMQITREAKSLLEEGHRNMVLDLSECTAITASFCGFVVSISNRAKELGAKIALVVPHKSFVYEVFKMLQLDTILELRDSFKPVNSPVTA